MNIWLHRISYLAEVSYPLLSKGYLSIGFSDFVEDSNFIENVLGTNGGNAFEESFDYFWGNRPRTRYNLWRFVAEMKKGDWIIVPSWGTFSIYEIDGDKPMYAGAVNTEGLKDWQGNSIVSKDGFIYKKKENDEANELIDLGFVWKVKPVALEISRYEYADSLLTSRMKIRTTNANITDLKQSVEEALSAFNAKKPINIHSKIVDATANTVLEILRKELNPDKFEYLVKWYFEKVGASEVFIPAKNEANKSGDADVVAFFEDIKAIIYIQVKFHEGETSSWAIEQIKDYKNNSEAMDDGYTRISWVISTADNYSEECFSLAKEEKVHLIDGRKFATMLLEAGISTLDKFI